MEGYVRACVSTRDVSLLLIDGQDEWEDRGDGTETCVHFQISHFFA